MQFRAATREDLSEIAKYTQASYIPDCKGVVIANEEGRLQAGFIFDSFTRSSCQAHLYVGNKMVFRHGFLEEVANYVFNTCNLLVVIAKVPEDNAAARKLNRHIGFEDIALIDDACDVGIGYAIMQLRREDCKYLDKEVH